MEFLGVSLIVLMLIVIVGLFLVFKKFSKIDTYTHSEIEQKEWELQYKQKLQELKIKEKEYQDLKTELENQKKENIEILKDLEQQKGYQLQFQKQYLEARDELKATLCQYLEMSEETVRKELYRLIDEELMSYKGKMIRQYENEARNEARKRASYIIAQATTRYAGEFAQERLVNVISLPNDALKGRVIGKDGRNIKAFEMITGVDVIIDETPSNIVLSSFNLYRRAIATKVLEELILDGRIHPSRIEEVFQRVSEEMEESLLQEGEDVVLNLALGYMHPDLKKMIGRLKYRASFGQNALGHSIEVANLAGIIAGELGGDARLARRAGILHDIGKSLTQDSGRNHVDLGYEICLKHQESPVVLNAIKAHHGNEEAKSIEAIAVCTADTLSAARPGARREALENFLKRATDLEAMVMKKMGVKQAYVINSGKEIRVIADWKQVSDDECAAMALEIAQEIEEGFQYPGEIKVHIIRESRATGVAR